MRFNVVYHVATLNHWQAVVEEQLSALLGNAGVDKLYVTIAAPSTALADSCRELIAGRIGSAGREVALHALTRHLDEFEHPAMGLIDHLAQRDEAPILYFHAKGVSHAPPKALVEKWRRYLNHFVARADACAVLLAQGEYDACGPLKLFDRQHGYTYFAGNFWMATAAYLRRLPPYADFARNPGSTYFLPLDRHLAEVAINRAKDMRALAVDGTDLTHESIWPFLQKVAV